MTPGRCGKCAPSCAAACPAKPQCGAPHAAGPCKSLRARAATCMGAAGLFHSLSTALPWLTSTQCSAAAPACWPHARRVSASRSRIASQAQAQRQPELLASASAVFACAGHAQPAPDRRGRRACAGQAGLSHEPAHTTPPDGGPGCPGREQDRAVGAPEHRGPRPPSCWQCPLLHGWSPEQAVPWSHAPAHAMPRPHSLPSATAGT